MSNHNLNMTQEEINAVYQNALVQHAIAESQKPENQNDKLKAAFDTVVKNCRTGKCEYNTKYRAAEQKYWVEIESLETKIPKALTEMTPEEEERLYQESVSKLQEPKELQLVEIFDDVEKKRIQKAAGYNL